MGLRPTIAHTMISNRERVGSGDRPHVRVIGAQVLSMTLSSTV
jgi:hypothetical protein